MQRLLNLLLLVGWFGFTGECTAATIIADSVADWDAARSNGIGIVAAQDTPEQGHLDSIGTGIWRYHSSGAPGDFAAGGAIGSTAMIWDSLLQKYVDGSTSGIGRNFANPSNSDTTVRPYSQRIWRSGYAGEVLVSGNFTNFSGLGTGMTADIFVDRNASLNLIPVSAIFDPNGTESLDFNFTVDVVPGDLIGFSMGPRGNFFNDGAFFHATITAVPEPSSAALFALALGVLAAPRRRRRVRLDPVASRAMSI